MTTYGEMTLTAPGWFSLEKKTADLRWRRVGEHQMTLQQRIATEKWEGGQLMTIVDEWRDVPIVDVDES